MIKRMKKMPNPKKKNNAAGPVRLSCPVSLAEGEGARPRFSMLGYTGALVTGFWDDFIIDLSGMTANDKFAILRQHQPDRIVGIASSWRVDDAGFHIEGEFVGSTQDAREVLELGREGYPWQCSIGVWPLEVSRLAAGATATVNGREVSGPCDIWTRSKVRECSFVTLGADGDTSATILQEGTFMDWNKMRKQLLRLGMPETASDEDMRAFYAALSEEEKDKAKKKAEEDEGEGKDDDEEKKKQKPLPKENALPAQHLAAPDNVADAVAKALAADRKRRADIKSLCGKFGFDELGESLCESGASLEAAQMRVLELASARMQPVGSSRYGIGMDESDKLRPLAAEGLYLRAGGTVEKPQEGSTQFRAMSLSQMARFFLERGGCSCRSMSDRQVASALLSGGQGKLLATRSDFKAIFADVAHRRLVQAYREAPATWRSFVNVVSASDFKPIQGITLSNAPDLLKVNENAEYKTGDLKASQETYRVAKYGRILSLTLEMIIDDDLRAFQRIPAMFGASASRLYGDLVYNIFKENPVMSDGNNLFSAAHNNLVSTGSAPSSDSLSEMRVMLRKQTGLQGETLDLQPRVMLIPLELETNAEILLRSTALPQDGMSQGVVNPWANRLIPVADPRLSAMSATAWYMVADPNQIDTIEMAFMDGQETPTIEEAEDYETDSFRYKCRTFAGVGVMDWRGFVKNPGASS